MTSQIGWIRAIDNELVNAHIGIADSSDSHDVAKQKLKSLIDFHIEVATDPSVNGGFSLQFDRSSLSNSFNRGVQSLEEATESARSMSTSLGNKLLVAPELTKRIVKIDVIAYHTPTGEGTCMTKQNRCVFLETRRFGTEHRCAMNLTEQIDDFGEYLVPLSNCVLHKDVK